MADIDYTHRNLIALDTAITRVAETRAIAIILAMATSPDAAPPNYELVSRALDGITALLDTAGEALRSIDTAQLRRIA